MAQELVTESCAFRGAFDQPGYIGNDEAAMFVGADDPQVRMKRGERIIRDFRTRCRYGAYECRLSGVRHAEQADVRKHLELELELAADPGLAASELAGRAIRARLEVKITEAAFAALREHRARLMVREVCNELARLEVRDDRSHGKSQHNVGFPAPVAVRALAFPAIFRTMDARITIVDQRVDIAVGHGVNGAAAAAVTAIGPAARHELFTAKARKAFPAFPG